MKRYLEPHQLFLQKLLLIKSKESSGKDKKYSLEDWGCTSYGLSSDDKEIISYLFELSQDGYFNFKKIILDKKFISVKSQLSRQTALAITLPSYQVPRSRDEYCGLGKTIHQKVLKNQSLTAKEALSLLEEIKSSESYLPLKIGSCY